MAADKSDDPGVLGNLPRSRPGQRSDKRGGGSRTASSAGAAPSSTASKPSPATRAKVTKAKAKARAKGTGTTARAAKKPAAPRKATTTAASSTPRPPEREPVTSLPQSDGGGTDPITGAVRLVGKVAEVGLKTAGGLLRKLPGR